MFFIWDYSHLESEIVKLSSLSFYLLFSPGFLIPVINLFGLFIVYFNVFGSIFVFCWWIVFLRLTFYFFKFDDYFINCLTFYFISVNYFWYFFLIDTSRSWFFLMSIRLAIERFWWSLQTDYNCYFIWISSFSKYLCCSVFNRLNSYRRWFNWFWRLSSRYEMISRFSFDTFLAITCYKWIFKRSTSISDFFRF